MPLILRRRLHIPPMSPFLRAAPLIFLTLHVNQWRIQDFPEEGAPTPKTAIILQFLCQKLHENERIRTPGGHVPGAPLRSANVNGTIVLH